MTNSINMEYARSLVGNLLFFAMRKPGAKENSAFKYVSADWIGLPGWFFWPQNRPGVFLLKLTNISNALPDHSVETFYRLFYYPSLEEPLFEQFSCSEQLLRASAFFSRKGVEFSTECPHCECNPTAFAELSEGKGIPTPEARQKISDELFAVGEIKFSWKNDDLSCVRVNATYRDQTRTKAAVEILAESGVVRLLEADEVDRDLPCWDLAAEFTQALVHFLPVVVHDHSVAEKIGNEVQASYSVKQTLCRTTGVIVE